MYYLGYNNYTHRRHKQVKRFNIGKVGVLMNSLGFVDVIVVPTRSLAQVTYTCNTKLNYYDL